MKYKTTKKEINNNYDNVIQISYCSLQHLLNYTPANAYITRAEGWACDIYTVNGNTVISTGYAPFGNITPPYDIVRFYDDKARKILNKYSNYNTVKKHLDELLNDFIETVTSESFTFELQPINQKSFYGKALVKCMSNGAKILYSYNTPIMKISKNGKMVRYYDDWTQTTGKHIKAFSGLNKQEFMQLKKVINLYR